MVTAALRHVAGDVPAALARITMPAWADEATVVPAATHGPASHVTECRAALVAVTGTEVQAEPPFEVVRTTPCPVRALTTLVAVVPTAVHGTRSIADPPEPEAPESDAAVHEISESTPMALGTDCKAQVVPPSAVNATTPLM